jgi:hypothetical protein
MPDETQYAVYLHANALEALGEAIKPYLSQGANGPHIVCTELDTGGALCEMCVEFKNAEGALVKSEVMVPIGMIRLVLSIGGIEDRFGFHGAD